MKMRWLLLLIPLPIILLGIANLIYINTHSEPRTAPQSDNTPEVVQTATQEQKPTVEELYRLTNEERAKVGVAPLQLDDRLNQSAQAKADDMVVNKYYGHVNPITKVSGVYTIPDYQPSCISGAENLNEASNAAETVSKWMQSPTHKKALLDQTYKVVGFGIAKNPYYYYVVQHFCDL